MVNEGTLDRLLRLIVGIVLVMIAIHYGVTWAYIGVVPLFTALVGWCPAYSVLGLKTCPAKIS